MVLATKSAMNRASHWHSFSGVFTVQQRTLAILELLALIFEFVPRSSLKSCSLVCRSWQEPALNAYWSDMDNRTDIWKSLVALLVPQRRNCACGFEARPFHLHNGENPSDTAWKRYFQRARLVRSITVYPQEINDMISDEILVLMSSLPLEMGRMLPRLTAVHLGLCIYEPTNNPWHFAGIFLHEGTRELTLDFEELDEMFFTGDASNSPEVQTASMVILEVPSLARNVTHLTIDTISHVVLSAFQEALKAMLPHMHALQLFTSTMCLSLTPSIVASMKKLGCLTSIVSSEQRSRLQRTPPIRMNPTNKDGAYYPFLEYLQLYGSLMDIRGIFSDERIRFSRLTYLRLDVETTEVTRIRDVIGAISYYADSLQDLTIVFLRTIERNNQPPQPGETNRPLQVEILRDLRKLRVYTNNETSCSEDDLVELMGHMPRLSHLFIMPRRIYDYASWKSPLRLANDLNYDEEESFLEQPRITQVWQQPRPPREGFNLSVLEKLTHIPNSLQFVTIPLHSSHHISRPGEVSSIGPHLMQLRSLTLKSPLRPNCKFCAEDVAEFLAKTLPSQCEIHTLKYGHRRAWSTVRVLLHFHRLGLSNVSLFPKHSQQAPRWANAN